MVNKGSFSWKLLNSAWILLAFIGAGWAGFLIIGRKAKEPKWTICGFVYTIALFGFFLIGMASFGDLSTTCVMLWLLTILITIVHSFIANRRYLMCREVLVSAREEEYNEEKTRDAIRRRYADKGIISKTSKSDKFVPPNSSSDTLHETAPAGNEKNKNSAQSQKLNINHCSEEDLRKLPGVSIITAKKAVEYRRSHGGFSSLDEFYEVISAKPHFILQLDNMIIYDRIVSEQENLNDAGGVQNNDKRKGRILDI